MLRTSATVLASLALFGLAGATASAQDVVMNSAETINVGNIKVALFPTALLDKGNTGTDLGLAGRLGFGIGPRFDIEAKAATFDGLKYYGGDFELWLLHSRSLNLSAGAGLHLIDFSSGDDMPGIDATLILSTRAHRHLELYGALKLAFESPKGPANNYTTAHLVPGIEYRVARDLDFLAEVGIAVKNNARSYASVGLAYYIH
jgi:hypothetical protein